MSSSRSPRRGRRRLAGLALAGAAVAAPAVAHALIQRRLRAPGAAGWGRTHRYAGHLGPVVFQEIGRGPAMVLLHAFGPGFDSRQWRAAAEALAPDFRIFAPDLPGWGRSAALPPGPELHLESLAAFLGEVVREPAVLVAAGHAAPYAVWLATEHPGLVRAVALAAPAGLEALDGAASPLVAALLQVPLLRVSVLDALTSRAVLGRYLRSFAYDAPERVDAALLEHHYRVSHLPAHRRTLAAYWRGELALPAASALRRLRAPVWIAWGGGGRAEGEGRAEPGSSTEAGSPAEAGPAGGAAVAEVAEAKGPPPLALPPGSRTETIAGSRALPHAERPVAFARALGRFLAQLPSA
jgi:pimeloyl-ACP methyl ester carboxylesterase